MSLNVFYSTLYRFETPFYSFWDFVCLRSSNSHLTWHFASLIFNVSVVINIFSALSCEKFRMAFFSVKFVKVQQLSHIFFSKIVVLVPDKNHTLEIPRITKLYTLKLYPYPLSPKSESHAQQSIIRLVNCCNARTVWFLHICIFYIFFLGTLLI